MGGQGAETTQLRDKGKQLGLAVWCFRVGGRKSMGTNHVNPKCEKCGNFHNIFANCPQIDKMVDRFLAWALPKDFAPDCGISFDGRKDDEWNKDKTWPIGTNLLNAEQAKQMIAYLFRS